MATLLPCFTPMIRIIFEQLFGCCGGIGSVAHAPEQLISFYALYGMLTHALFRTASKIRETVFNLTRNYPSTDSIPH